MFTRLPLALVLLIAAAVAISSACDAPTCTSGTYGAIPGYIPSSNGCGSYGVSAEAPFGVTPCCNQHDLCYQSCNSTKTQCDDAFDQCMKNVCNTEEELEKLACLVEAEAFYAAVMNLGCRAYENNQQEACQCSDPTTSPSPAPSPASSAAPSPSAASSPASSAAPSPGASASPSTQPSASPVVIGACKNTGAWPDVYGCCPVKLNNSAFYRDAHGCYPVITKVGIRYPDATGCYPDASGIYVSGACPAAQRCSTECLSA